jgi:hypothetical protein
MTTAVYLCNHLKMIVQNGTCSGMCNKTEYQQIISVSFIDGCVGGHASISATKEVPLEENTQKISIR